MSAYLDGELPPTRREALREHLSGCAACAARERELRVAWELVPSLPAPPATRDLWPGVLRGLVEPTGRKSWEVRRSLALVHALVGACALAGVAVGTLFASQFAKTPAGRPAVVLAPSGDDSLAEAFGDPALGSWSAASSRSSPSSGGAPGPGGAGEDAR